MSPTDPADLRDRLRPVFDHVREQMATQLADLPDDQLFGAIELTLRDLAHDLATAAHQAALDGRKKGATTGPAAPARTARAMPASSATGRTTS
jgi:hypothetical protein